MDAAAPAGWLERVAQSLCEHEERRDTLLNFPPRYEVLDEISRGGMGIVYRAWDPQLGRNVALKVLRSEDGSAEAEAHERFQREARLAASLHHPNIVPIYDTGTWNGQDYIAMQLIEGRTLDRAKPDRRQALAFVRDAARALQHAHEQGIVHRDIKPSNLMVDGQSRVFVTDFGIARHAVATAGMTSPGTVVGTPAYMSPEQAQGLPADARSDVYSLGATLYELLTGRPPYIGEAVDVVDAVRTKDPDSARRLVTDLSKNAEAILAGAMERRPADRYASAAALADDIDRYLKGERPLRRPRGVSYKVRREFVRHPWRSAATIVFGALVLTTAIAVREAIRNKSVPPITTIISPTTPRSGEISVPVPVVTLEVPVDPSLLVNQLYIKAGRLLENGRLDAARSALGELFLVSLDRGMELLPKLRVREFVEGLRSLDASIEKGEAAGFEMVYRTLLAPRYQSQANRDSRLATTVLRLVFALKDPSESLRWANEIDNLNLSDPAIHALRIRILQKLGHWEAAQNYLDRYLSLIKNTQALYPEAADLLHRQAQQTMAEKHWDKAALLLDQAEFFDPKLAIVAHDRGLVRYFGESRVTEALDVDLTNALRRDSSLIPELPYREVALAYAHAQEERVQKVENQEERHRIWSQSLSWLTIILVKSAPGDPDILLECATLRRRLGDLPAALADARLALKGANNETTNLAVGQLEYLQGKQAVPIVASIRLAIEHFSVAHTHSPRDHRPLYWRGLCYSMLPDRESEAAVKDLLKARELNPNSPYLSLRLSSARLTLLLEKEQNDTWKEAADEAALLLKDPNGLSEEDFLAAGYDMTVAAKAIALKQLTRDAHINRAIAFFLGGQPASSIKESSAAILSDESSSNAYYWRGRARFDAHEFRPAIGDFRLALRRTTDEKDRKNLEFWLNASVNHEKD